MITIENCANSVLSCINAEKGGANRIELCAGLPEGGTTPSLGMAKIAVKEISIPIYAIIRPRSGDFLYDSLELQQMLSDIYAFREIGISGFVFGVLTPKGTLDYEANHLLIRAAEELPCTLHRAFDMTCNYSQALEDAIALGFSRILTSGGAATAILGSETIQKLHKQAAGRINIMAGGGVRPENVIDLIKKTGVTEVHGTFQTHLESKMEYRNRDVSMGQTVQVQEYSYPTTDIQKLLHIRHALDRLVSQNEED